MARRLSVHWKGFSDSQGGEKTVWHLAIHSVIERGTEQNRMQKRQVQITEWGTANNKMHK